MSEQPRARFVNHLPDLMTWEDYAEADRRKVIRIRLTVSEEGLEVLGDSPRSPLVSLGPLALRMLSPQAGYAVSPSGVYCISIVM